MPPQDEGRENCARQASHLVLTASGRRKPQSAPWHRSTAMARPPQLAPSAQAPRGPSALRRKQHVPHHTAAKRAWSQVCMLASVPVRGSAPAPPSAGPPQLQTAPQWQPQRLTNRQPPPSPPSHDPRVVRDRCQAQATAHWHAPGDRWNATPSRTCACARAWAAVELCPLTAHAPGACRLGPGAPMTERQAAPTHHQQSSAAHMPTTRRESPA